MPDTGRQSQPKPSDFELKLLRALWRAQRLSAREIHDATSRETQWSYSATRKTLDRMEEKGLIRVELVHGVKTYAAARPKLETLAGLIRDFARNVLDADAPMPVAAFSHSKLLDDDEMRALEALLEAGDETDERA
ncbi:MAG: BlaI/MecI/CopY family transcriptional regulator [Pseudomonadota bacterium]